jgi:ketosteroid isomerase-like protein
MPDPPPESLLTRYVLENPYPVGVGLLLVGLLIGWVGLRDGRAERLRLALLPLALGAGVLVAGLTVVTSGERARRVVRDLVAAVAEEDLVAAVSHLTDDAVLHLGREPSVGRDLDFIVSGLSRFADRYEVESNLIMRSRAYTETRDRATVHLVCRTITERFGPTVSQWVVVVERRGEAWKVSRLRLVSINGRPPPSSW